jgi:hypothetical protein
VCDGWAQCPQRDDEWLCDENPCPDGCVCQGLAFVCRQPSHLQLFPNLRYLDGSGSGLSLSDLQSNVYLMHLVLTWCGLKSKDLIRMKNLNLRFLDLSHNLVE